ncbi:MAG: hypothetical protein HC828_13670 [Blastochloris sp.]|nr:hypothetical protein [Blastochloris sp.]
MRHSWLIILVVILVLASSSSASAEIITIARPTQQKLPTSRCLATTSAKKSPGFSRPPRCKSLFRP